MSKNDGLRLPGLRVRIQTHAPGLLGKFLATAAGVVALTAVFVLSLVLVAVATVTAVVVGGFLWWKTRGLRKRIREQQYGGHIIEGEVVRDNSKR
jgi:hypothetical protein